MTTKRILITGANSGMGKALSLRLARKGYEVVMLCRNLDRGKRALDDVRRESGTDRAHLITCDLASLKSVRACAEQFKRDFNNLDVLINNAGVILPSRQETADGYELQFGVNHLGHFLLTLLLVPTLRKSAAARIVIVSSGAHAIGKPHFDDIHLQKKWSIFKAYSRSKLANLLFARELAKRLESDNITVNCLHPGAVGSNMGVNRDTGFGETLMSLLRPFFRTPDEGADTAYYLAVSPEVEGVTGKYFKDRKEKSPAKRAIDSETGQRLWKLSEEMVGLTWADINA